MKTRTEKLPKDKVCSCGHKHVAGVTVQEKLTEESKSMPGQFWFDCLSGCGSTLLVITKG